MSKETILLRIKELMDEIKKIKKEQEKIEILNKIQDSLKAVSPLKKEPVSCVKWIEANKVKANAYNPNKVAPPEMQLLYKSIKEDGYTQPIVAFFDKQENKYIVVDGFHRNRIAKEYDDIKKRTKGFLPIVVIEKTLKERMASTIRHNRARGTHGIQSMSEIVEELYFMGWSDKKIGENLGMDRDEVLRLKQFTGLGNLFRNKDFSKSWV